MRVVAGPTSEYRRKVLEYKRKRKTTVVMSRWVLISSRKRGTYTHGVVDMKDAKLS